MRTTMLATTLAVGLVGAVFWALWMIERPRIIEVSIADCEEPRTITGLTASGAFVELTTRGYHGKAVGFWGSESTPPYDILWELRFTYGDQDISIPGEYLRDLSNIIESSRIESVEQLISVDQSRLAVVPRGVDFLVCIRGGDGGHSYRANFAVRQRSNGTISVTRTIDGYEW